MIRTIVSGVFVAGVCAGAGLAETPAFPDWAGFWAYDPAHCARTDQPGGEDAPEWIGPDGIFGLEYSCEFVAILPLGIGKSWRMDLACLDAGFEENISEIMVLTHEDRLLRIFDDGYHVSLHRCAHEQDG